MEYSNQQQIDDYILNRLSPEDRQAFELEIQQNPGLASEIQVHQAIQQGLAINRHRKIKAKLKKFHQSEFSPINNLLKGRWNKIHWSLWLILVALIIGLAWFIITLNPTPAPDQLYAQYYSPYSVSLQNRNSALEEELAAASLLYNQGQYEDALPALQALSTRAPEDMRLFLATGICQMELNQYPEAIQSLNIILERKDPLLSDQARWYSAMSQLAQEDYISAKTSLQPLADDPDADHHEDALVILKSL